MQRLFFIISVGLVLATAQTTQARETYFDAVTADGPLVYYTFDEIGGTTAVDHSGNGHDGTYNGDIDLSQRSATGRGLKMNYAPIDDPDTAYVEVPGIAGTEQLTQFTLEWIWTADGAQMLENDLDDRRISISFFSTDNTVVEGETTPESVFPEAGGINKGGHRVALAPTRLTEDDPATPIDERHLDGGHVLSDGEGFGTVVFGPSGVDLERGEQMHIAYVVNTTTADVPGGVPFLSERWYINGTSLFFDDEGEPPGFRNRDNAISESEENNPMTLTVPSQIGNCTGCVNPNTADDDVNELVDLGGPNPMFLDDFAIFDTALTDEQIAAHAEAALFRPFELVIERDTGEATLVSTDDDLGGVDLTNMSLLSAVGTLDPDGWNSLSAQGEPGWTELAATNNELIELGGETQTVFPAGEIDLGAIWTPSPFEDVRFFTEDGIKATVRYEGDPVLFADLNVDGSIDELDWVTFRDNYGSSLAGLTPVEAYFQSDMDANGEHNASDWLAFVAAYDAAQSAGAGASVPEPGALALLAIGGLVCLGRRVRAAALVLAIAVGLAMVAPAQAQLVVHYNFDDSDNLFTNIANPGVHDGTNGGAELGDRFDLPLESADGGAVDFFQDDHDLNRDAIVVDGLDTNFFDGTTDWAFELDFRTDGVFNRSQFEDGTDTVITNSGVLLMNGVDPADVFNPAFDADNPHGGPWKPANGLGPDDGAGNLVPGFLGSDNMLIHLNQTREALCIEEGECGGAVPGEFAFNKPGGVRLVHGWHNGQDTSNKPQSHGRWTNSETFGIQDNGGVFDGGREAVTIPSALRTLDGPEDLSDTPVHLSDGEWHNIKYVYVAPEGVNTDVDTAEEAGNTPKGTYFIRVDGVWVTEMQERGNQQVERDAAGDPLTRYTVLGNTVDQAMVFATGNAPGTFQGEMDNVKIYGTGEAPSVMNVVVNLDTDEVVVHGGEFAREIRSFFLTSASGSLEPDEWNSFSDQAVAGAGDAGNQWEELNASAFELAEGFLNGSSVFSDTENSEVSIGNVFGGVPDPVDGDYNGNLVVDAPDYNVWRDSFGEVGEGLPADGNEDGEINAPDYNVWRDNFGERGTEGGVQDLVATIGVEVPNLLSAETNGGLGPSELELIQIPVSYIGGDGGGAAGVPEPSALLMVIVSLALAALRRVR